MSAEVLCRAAALMRERASYADLGPWVRRGDDCGCCDELRNSDGYQIAEQVDVANSEHIAAWHPAVALAVAGWLDSTADHIDPETAVDGGCDECEDHAIAVALNYLGEQPCPS